MMNSPYYFGPPALGDPVYRMAPISPAKKILGHYKDLTSPENPFLLGSK
jgi:hypothetical protein